MVWLYWTGFAMLVGAELNARAGEANQGKVLSNRKGSTQINEAHRLTSRNSEVWDIWTLRSFHSTQAQLLVLDVRRCMKSLPPASRTSCKDRSDMVICGWRKIRCNRDSHHALGRSGRHIPRTRALRQRMPGRMTLI
jgi:hypothetical protein